MRLVTCLMLIATALCAMGCTSRHISLVHPETKEGAICRAEGWGWLGAPIAASNSRKHVRIFKAAGYIPVQEYVDRGGRLEDIKAASIVFTSDIDGATIYAGAADGGDGTWIKLVNKAPWILLLDTKEVIPECYKARANGRESEVVCFKSRDHVRRVHFTFK